MVSSTAGFISSSQQPNQYQQDIVPVGQIKRRDSDQSLIGSAHELNLYNMRESIMISHTPQVHSQPNLVDVSYRSQEVQMGKEISSTCGSIEPKNRNQEQKNEGHSNQKDQCSVLTKTVLVTTDDITEQSTELLHVEKKE